MRGRWLKNKHPASPILKDQRGVVTYDSQHSLTDYLKIANSLPETKAPQAFVQTDGGSTIAMKKASATP
tara:strand:+ start:400 stop:606 length:207 start_codon:yes stop_codon:yes gene_type:complete